MVRFASLFRASAIQAQSVWVIQAIEGAAVKPVEMSTNPPLPEISSRSI